jgi:hypothetical protein
MSSWQSEETRRRRRLFPGQVEEDQLPTQNQKDPAEQADDETREHSRH